MLFRLLFAISIFASILIFGWYFWADLHMLLAKYNIELGGIGSAASIIGIAIPLLIWALKPEKKAKLTTHNKKDNKISGQNEENYAWREQQQEAQRGREYLDKLLLDNKLTNLIPIQQLAEAKAQFTRALDSGDAYKAQIKMQEYLELARAAYGSADPYNEILASSRLSYEELLDSIEALPNPKRKSRTSTF